MTGRYFLPPRCDLTRERTCTTRYVRGEQVNCKPAEWTNLLLVPTRLQNSHHNLKVCFEICEYQVSIRTEDKTLTNVEFS